MQNWKTLYGELSEFITTNISMVKWLDLWHNQINFLDTEHPFPTPAVFLGFRSNAMQDLGTKVQKVTLQVDVYIYYETFADTYTGAFNQDAALAFLELFDSINQLLHGSSGTNYSSMRRTAFNPVDTGNAGNLYLVNYICELVDYSAQKVYEEGSFSELNIQPKEDNQFIIN